MVHISASLRWYYHDSLTNLMKLFNLNRRVASAVLDLQSRKTVLFRRSSYNVLTFLHKCGLDLSRLDRHMALLACSPPELATRQQILTECGVSVTVATLHQIKSVQKAFVFSLRYDGLLSNTTDPLTIICRSVEPCLTTASASATATATPSASASASASATDATVRFRLLSSSPNLDQLRLLQLRQAVAEQLLSSSFSCQLAEARQLVWRVPLLRLSLQLLCRNISLLLRQNISLNCVFDDPYLLSVCPDVLEEKLLRKSVSALSLCSSSSSAAAAAVPSDASSSSSSAAAAAAASITTTAAGVVTAPSSTSTSTAAAVTTSSASTKTTITTVAAEAAHGSTVDAANRRLGVSQVDRVFAEFGISLCSENGRHFRSSLATVHPAVLRHCLTVIHKDAGLWSQRNTVPFFSLLNAIPPLLVNARLMGGGAAGGGGGGGGGGWSGGGGGGSGGGGNGGCGGAATGADQIGAYEATLSRAECQLLETIISQYQLLNRWLDRHHFISSATASATATAGRTRCQLVSLLAEQLQLPNRLVRQQLQLHRFYRWVPPAAAMTTLQTLLLMGYTHTQIADAVQICLYPSWLVVETLCQPNPSPTVTSSTASSASTATTSVDKYGDSPAGSCAYELQMALLAIERRYRFTQMAAVQQESASASVTSQPPTDTGHVTLSSAPRGKTCVAGAPGEEATVSDDLSASVTAEDRASVRQFIRGLIRPLSCQ